MKNKHAQALGRLGGKVKSEKKARVARENGKRGGRKKLIYTEFEDQAQAKYVEEKRER